ncbi:DegT/DnrJ/EryC1/StrS family aminotransferase [Candidatus Micrarchaeota archaeon]|nr:DegT/DnrJ/EryC1/StrS family aminotransferase [Candidatus Micrarchaeota archaeon]
MIPIAKPLIGNEEKEAVLKVLESGILTGGEIVEEFEKRLAKYCGYKYGIAVNSGTAALHISCAALGIKNGDKVIVPDFTFIATANAAQYVGAKPIFAEVDEKTFNIDAKNLKETAKAIIPVSLYGQAYNVDEVKEFAKKNSMHIISDNCQAVGTKWKGKRNFSDDCAVLSFYPTKNITTAEGGAVLTDSEEIAGECRLWRNIGQKKPFEYIHLGHNFRMSSIHAAIGIEQLKKIDRFISLRIKNAKLINEYLDGIKNITIPYTDQNAIHTYNQYTIKIKNGKRDALKAFLAKNSIATAIYYPKPLSQLSVFSDSRKNHNTIAKKLSEEVLSVPIHPSITEENILVIAEKIKKFMS